MPEPVEIGLWEIERGELLGDLDNQGWEMEKNTEKYLALQRCGGRGGGGGPSRTALDPCHILCRGLVTVERGSNRL